VNRLTIDLRKLQRNIETIGGWMDRHGASWTLVAKVLCGHTDTLRALQLLGIRSMGDSRVANLNAIERIIPDFESWYLRVSDMSSVKQVVAMADVSLNSELDVIEAINEEAGRINKIHRIIIMIELGDLREGILPGSLIRFYEQVFDLSNIEVIGIGANLGCLAGAVPSVDQFAQLALYRELLELKFRRKLPMLSAGSSVVLPLLLDGKLPKAINHFRIGEALFLGTDLINGGTLPGLYDDVPVLEAEIAEIKEKSLRSLVETSHVQPFDSANGQNDSEPAVGEWGYRALVSVGQLDTDVSGLTPIDNRYHIAGASSDITVVNLGDNPDNLKIGDTIKFKLNYSAFLRIMSVKYIDKVVIPQLHEFETATKDRSWQLDPALDSVDWDSQ
jgi:predicted amino acid racemase